MADAGIGEAAAAEGAKTAGEAGAGAALGSGATDLSLAAAGTGLEAGTIAGGAASSAAAAEGLGVIGGGAAGAAPSLGQQAMTAIGSGIASKAISTLMTPKMPSAPGVPAPTEMPDAATIAAAKQRAIIQQISNRGRASTILTDGNSTKLGN